MSFACGHNKTGLGQGFRILNCGLKGIEQKTEDRRQMTEFGMRKAEFGMKVEYERQGQEDGEQVGES
jgi:hypothetical protein